MLSKCFSIPTCRFRDDHDLNNDQKQFFEALVIAGIVYVIGVIIFQIWTITVTNKARKEIGASKMILPTTFVNNKI